MRVSRASILLVAVVACAWFALGARQAHEVARATIIIVERPTAAQAQTATSLLESAGTLNPDLEVDVLRGRLALDRGELPTARRILEGVVRREPKNLEAWIWLARASGGAPSTFVLAVKRVASLLPKVPPPSG